MYSREYARRIFGGIHDSQNHNHEFTIRDSRFKHECDSIVELTSRRRVTVTIRECQGPLVTVERERELSTKR